MTSNGKRTNISIHNTVQLKRTPKPLFELPRENLSEAELYRKSTSDRRKPRVAHEAWFPLPVITKPIAPAKLVAQPTPPKKGSSSKGFLRIKPRKVRQINETVTLDSSTLHSKSTSSGVNKIKTILGEVLDCDEEKKIEQTIVEDREKKREKKSKGVSEGKRKFGEIDCGNVKKNKRNKEENEKKRVNKIKTILGEVLDCDEEKKIEQTIVEVREKKREKKSKGVSEGKRKFGEIDCGNVKKNKRNKEENEKKRVNKIKTILGEVLDCDEEKKIEQTIVEDREKKREKKSKGVSEGKRKFGEIDCGSVKKNKRNKEENEKKRVNKIKTILGEVLDCDEEKKIEQTIVEDREKKREKKSKGVSEGKRKFGEIDCGNVKKNKRNKEENEKKRVNKGGQDKVIQQYSDSILFQ